MSFPFKFRFISNNIQNEKSMLENWKLRHDQVSGVTGLKSRNTTNLKDVLASSSIENDHLIFLIIVCACRSITEQLFAEKIWPGFSLLVCSFRRRVYE